MARDSAGLAVFVGIEIIGATGGGALSCVSLPRQKAVSVMLLLSENLHYSCGCDSYFEYFMKIRYKRLNI